jgi:hypothetical protein
MFAMDNDRVPSLAPALAGRVAQGESAASTIFLEIRH